MFYLMRIERASRCSTSKS